MAEHMHESVDVAYMNWCVVEVLVYRILWENSWTIIKVDDELPGLSVMDIYFTTP